MKSMRFYGATLIEGLISATVLVIGVVGILIMLQSAASSTRDAAVAFQATIFASSRLEATAALGFCTLRDAGYPASPPLGSTTQTTNTPTSSGGDGGTDSDVTGRYYYSNTFVDNIVPPPGSSSSGAFPAVNVTVTTTWRNGIQLERTTRLSRIVTKGVDAGC